MESSSRPNRSDVHLSLEEEERIQDETREHFDGLAPKRHTKPQRSEYSSNYVDANNKADNVIPEYAQFQRLENDQEVLLKLTWCFQHYQDIPSLPYPQSGG